MRRYNSSDYRFSASSSELVVAYERGVRTFTGSSLAYVNLAGHVYNHCHFDGSVFDHANLSGASLVGSNLRYTSCHETNLSGANLHDAYCGYGSFIGADFKGAYLVGTNFHHAELWCADFTGASVPSDSHDVLAEILRQAANNDTGKLLFAGIVLLERQWCWRTFLKRRAEFPRHVWDWAVREIKTWPTLARALAEAEEELAQDREVERREASNKTRAQRLIDLSQEPTAKLTPKTRPTTTTTTTRPTTPRKKRDQTA
jgi:hypothetical protein